MILNDTTFTKSSLHAYSYGDLIQFSQLLLHRINSSSVAQSSLIVLQAESNPLTVHIIASCWILQIPFIALPASVSELDLTSYLSNLNPTHVIGDKLFIETVKKATKQIEPIISDSLLLDPTINNIHSESGNINADISILKDLKSNKKQVFCYLYTSGTTGKPKCVPISRGQIIAATESTQKSLPFGQNDQWLLTIPLNHIGGISIVTRSLLSGSSIRLIDKFEKNVVTDILHNENQVTFCSLVPTQLHKLLQNSGFRVHSEFKGILLGGGPIPESLIEMSRFRNIPVIPSFGMTETAAQCIAVPFDEIFASPPGSCGKPLHGIEVEIRNTNEIDPDSHSFSLLWVKGEQIIKRYLSQRDNEGSFDDNGWFNTGDYAEIDAKGFIHILMRRSDRIVTGGKNVNPIEIESLLQQMPGISEVAIVGLPSELWGQEITVAIPLSAENQLISIDDIKSFLHDKIESYKLPKQLVFVDTIPKTNSGKIKRSSLLEKINS